MRRFLTALVVVALLGACGSADSSDTSASSSAVTTTVSSNPAVVVAGGAALTERQAEMVTVAEQFIADWRANDGKGVASLMTADGYVVMPGENLTLLVSDGTLQKRVESIAAYSTLHALDPMFVHQDWIAVAGRIDSMNLDWLIVLEFTSSGDVKIGSMTDFH
jgi:hypothetical protein